MADIKQMYKTVMDDNFPEEMKISFGDQTLIYKKRSWKIADDSGEVIEKGLRYGENPGQEAALYELVNGNLTLGDCKFIDPGKGMVSCLSEEELLQFGKHPGKTNLTDIDNALNIMRYLKDTPACSIMKHNNPCGVSYGSSAEDAYVKANLADALAAFGGAAVFNVPVTKKCAEEIKHNYLEVVAAPGYEEGAVDILKGRKNLRIVEISKIDKIREYAGERFIDFKALIDGGIVVQQSPLNRIKDASDFMPAETTYKGEQYNIKRMPTDKEMEDLLFGWSVEQGITSNSVIFVKDGTTVGIGTGEQDRVGVTEIAIYKAYKKTADRIALRKHDCLFFEVELLVKSGELPQSAVSEINEEVKSVHGNLVDSVAVSDAFFPKRDAVDAIIGEGVRAIVQPGGSMADKEIIEVCNEADPAVAMVFTAQRAFKH
ncbi:MAG: IMP cyclohydrolase [Planctomycetota bacterium]|jgi:phosphoribosylaminoimidazolecarboxamide formyltransferase/IMP cyclohydrolase